jgi:hypothetical protein
MVLSSTQSLRLYDLAHTTVIGLRPRSGSIRGSFPRQRDDYYDARMSSRRRLIATKRRPQGPRTAGTQKPVKHRTRSVKITKLSRSSAVSDVLIGTGQQELALQVRRFANQMPEPMTEKEHMAAAMLRHLRDSGVFERPATR